MTEGFAECYGVPETEKLSSVCEVQGKLPKEGVSGSPSSEAE